MEKLNPWKTREARSMRLHNIYFVLTVCGAPFLGSCLHEALGSHVQGIHVLSGQKLAVAVAGNLGAQDKLSGQLHLPEVGGGGELRELCDGLTWWREEGTSIHE